LAAHRGTLAVAVTGYGDAASPDPLVQRSALALGIARAQAVAAALTGAGVPDAALRIAAEAMGRGATVRLVN
jgi:outer membrane protein OmpA-like peptidoglycan-associated protein